MTHSPLARALTRRLADPSSAYVSRHLQCPRQCYKKIDKLGHALDQDLKACDAESKNQLLQPLAKIALAVKEMLNVSDKRDQDQIKSWLYERMQRLAHIAVIKSGELFRGFFIKVKKFDSQVPLENPDLQALEKETFELSAACQRWEETFKEASVEDVALCSDKIEKAWEALVNKISSKGFRDTVRTDYAYYVCHQKALEIDLVFRGLFSIKSALGWRQEENFSSFDGLLQKHHQLKSEIASLEENLRKMMTVMDSSSDDEAETCDLEDGEIVQKIQGFDKQLRAIDATLKKMFCADHAPAFKRLTTEAHSLRTILSMNLLHA